MSRAALKEIAILKKLNENDIEDKFHTIKLASSFTHKNHVCLVFECLNIDLRQVLKKFGKGIGLNLKAIRSYAAQLFLALSLLKKCEIIHADVITWLITDQT